MQTLIAPYGNVLKPLLAAGDAAAQLRREAVGLPSIELDWRQTAELEMLLNGAYSPLTGYMGQTEVRAVQEHFRLADNVTFWPAPVTLRVREKAAAPLKIGGRAALRDAEGYMLAVLELSDMWPAPEAGLVHLGGPLLGVDLPPRHDFRELRLSPAELRGLFARRGWHRVAAYQARHAMHRAQYEFCLRTAIAEEANLLLHPWAGGDMVESGDYFSLARSYQAVLKRFPSATTQLALLPGLPPPASTRDILLRAIVARNYGCAVLIIGGEFQPEGERRRGEDIARPHEDLDPAAQALALGVKLIPFPRLVYSEDRGEFLSANEVSAGTRVRALAGDEFMQRLRRGQKIPDWYSFPEVIAELQKACPPRERQGFTVFFTGLSGAGKSTLARALAARLMEIGNRPVTLLDGDIVRRHLSSELGFSREHRDINVRRIGFVASEITKNRGVAICAPIAPYRQTRRDVRTMIEAVGGFVEVHVATPIETCEARDRKGLYAKARAGLIPEFTGVSDPYEIPEKPELALDTSELTVDEAIQRILLKLEHEGYLR